MTKQLAMGVAVIGLLGVLTLPLQAAVYYWDTDGATAGSGVTGGASYSKWTTLSYWSPDSTGSSATSGWVSGSDAVFAAGTDGAVAYTVMSDNVDLTANSISVEEGTLTLFNTAGANSRKYTILSGLFNVDSGASATTYGSIYAYNFTKTGLGTLTLGGSANEGSPGHTGWIFANGGTLITGRESTPANVVLSVDSANSSTYGFSYNFNSAITRGFVGLTDGRNGGGTANVSLLGNTSQVFQLNPQVGSSYSFSGALTMTTALFEKTGPGMQVFQGATTFGTTPTRLSAGTLVLDFGTDNNDKLSTTATLTMRNATLKVIGNGGAATSTTIGNLTLDTSGNAGQNSWQVVSGNNQNATLTAGSITRAAGSSGGGSLDVTLTNTGSGVAAAQTTSPNTGYGLLGTGTSSAAAGVAYATVNGGRDWAVKSNGTTPALGDIVAMTGYTFENNPALWATGQHVSSQTSGFSGTLAADLAINSLRFDQTGTVAINAANKLTVNSGGILVTPNVGAGGASLTGGKVTSATASGTSELIVHQYDTDAAFTVASQVTGAIALSKTGPGTVVLGNAANDYTGTTKILGGVLAVTADGALGAAAGATLLSPGGTLEFRNVNYSTAEPITLSGAQTGCNGLGAIYATGGQSTYAGVLTFAAGGNGRDAIGVAAGSEFVYSGAASLGNGATFAKLGPGTWTLTGTLNQGNSVSSLYIYDGTFRMAGPVGTATGTGQGVAFFARRGGTFKIDNTGAGNNNNDRIKSGSTSFYGVILDSANFVYLGNESVDSMEVDEQCLWLNSGENLIEIQRGGSQVAQVEFGTTGNNAGGLRRFNNGTVLFRGTNLGAALYHTGSDSSNIFFLGNAANKIPALVGSVDYATNPLATNLKIIPYAIGQQGTTGSGDTFVTYESNTGMAPLHGVIPLAAGNYYTAGIAAAATTDNVKLAAGETLAAAKTLNSLILNNAAAGPTLVVDATGSGALTLTAGALLAPGAGDVSITAPITFGNSEGVVSVTGSGTVTIDRIASTGALTKTGPGTLVLTGSATSLAGAVNVNGGTLLINAPGAAGTGGVFVRYGATLGGFGSTTGNVYVAFGGSVAPGNSPGVLSTGNLSMDAGARLLIDITGDLASQYDSVDVTGWVNLLYDNGLNNYDPALGGTVLVLDVSPDPSLTLGDTFTIIRNDGTTDPVLGIFAGLPQGAGLSVGVYSFTVSYVGENGAATGGNDVVLTLTAVPEPATLGLLALGFLPLLRRRRR